VLPLIGVEPQAFVASGPEVWQKQSPVSALRLFLDSRGDTLTPQPTAVSIGICTQFRKARSGLFSFYGLTTAHRLGLGVNFQKKKQQQVTYPVFNTTILPNLSALTYFVQPKSVFLVSADTDHYVQDLRASRLVACPHLFGALNE
jgi:hypothetical protein